MPSSTWGTGTDTFAVDYLTAQMTNDYISSDASNHAMSALELKRITGHFNAGVDNTTGNSTPEDTPLSLVQDGASQGYYRTIKYSSHYADNYFFTRNVLMYDKHIITDVTDIQRLVWKPTVTEYSFDNAQMADGTTTNIKCYVISQFEENKVDILKKGKTDEYTTTGVNIIPAIISPDTPNHLQGFNYWNRNSDTANWVDRILERYNQTYGRGTDNVGRYCPVFGNQSPIVLPNSANDTSKWAIDDTGHYAARFTYKANDQYSYLWTSYCQVKYWVCSEDELLHVLSRSGLKFVYKNTMYKPIAENGVITGYTSDMTKESEWDKWHNYTDHTVPITPPEPTGDNENKEIEMPLAYIGGTGGFVQFIKINSAGLASADDISAALSRFDITTIGKDLLRNFVSYKCFAVLSIDPNDTVTRQITVDGHGLTDENNNPLNGQVIGSVLPIDFEIGTPSRYFNDFRDFAPYTKIEAYVPFCGWFALPSWCIGHKITGTMFTDLYNGTVKAVIFAGSTVVAEVGGCCSYDIPFVADATGAKAGAVISSALSTAAATAATVSMPNVATGIAAVTSAANTISAVNSNDTTLKGVLGDGSNLNGLLHCYLKVTRPQSPTRTNEIPNAYKHEVGIPTYKAITLTSGDGYTQILDANIEGAMTDREKQMIIDGFRHGLIL